jgi:hypothetical protein
MEKYGCSEKTRRIIHKRYNTSLVKDGYAISDKKISRKGMKNLLKMRTTPGIKIWVMFVLTQLKIK